MPTPSGSARLGADDQGRLAAEPRRGHQLPERPRQGLGQILGDQAGADQIGALPVQPHPRAGRQKRGHALCQQAEDEARRARGEPLAELGPSPGFRDLKWVKPVHVGDTISYGTEVVELRPLESRPGWGMIFVRNTGVNQRGEAVISFISSAFVERRERQSQAS